MGRIAVGVDGSAAADRALRWAVLEASLRDDSIELVHAFVIHPLSAVFGETDRDLARAGLNATVERNREVLASVTWSTTLVDAAGFAASALVEAAAGADLVVVGARGAGGFPRLALGSTGYRTAAHAPVPVAVVPNAAVDDDGRRPIIVGVDDSPVSRRALHWALDEAARRSTSVTVVHSYLLPVDLSPLGALNQSLYDDVRTRAYADAKELVDRVVDAARVPEGVDVRRVVRAGSPAGVLLDDAAGQLLVVGSVGRGTFSRTVFGSVSRQILHHTEHPVVVVP